MFQKSGLNVVKHSYYDEKNNCLDFENMYKDINNLKSGDALLLHGCCHNPTGADLSIDQWSQIASLCKKNGILPFVDLVYLIDIVSCCCCCCCCCCSTCYYLLLLQ